MMRILDSKKIQYQEYLYGNIPAISGFEVVKVLNEDEKNFLKH